MKQLLINALTQICSNVFLQGTFNSNEEYPSEFITFWTNYADNDDFYDNCENSTDWNFSVMYYSNDPALVNSKPLLIINALKAVGFIPQGKGHDIPSDVPTHTGWALEFIGIENL